jgi:drug/metabolite transporter (DMT)-like permease
MDDPRVKPVASPLSERNCLTGMATASEVRNSITAPLRRQGGVVLMVLATAFFTTMGAFVKALGKGFPVLEANFFRGLVGVPILLAIVWRARLPIFVKSKTHMLLRSGFGTAAMFCYFYSLERLPLTDAVLIGRTLPVFMAILAPFLLKESATRSALLAIILGLTGAHLVLSPNLAVANRAGLVGLLGALFGSLAYIFIRRLHATDSTMVIVLDFTLFITVATGLLGLPSFVMPTPLQTLYLLGVGIFGTIGQILLTRALSRDRAPIVAAADYSSVVLAAVYGFLFWREIPSWNAIAGGVLIVASGLFLVLSRRGVYEPPAEKIL